MMLGMAGGGLAALALLEAVQPDYGIVHYFPTDGNKVYIRRMKLAAGYTVETHEHKYDHYALLGSGEAIVELDGKCTRYIGPDVVEIKAGVKHRIQAVSDITWFCVHGTEEADATKIDEVLIKQE